MAAEPGGPQDGDRLTRTRGPADAAVNAAARYRPEASATRQSPSPGPADGLLLDAEPVAPEEVSAVTGANITGLIVAACLIGYLLLARKYPDRF